MQWDIVGKRSALPVFRRARLGEYGRSNLEVNEGTKKVGVSTAEGERDEGGGPRERRFLNRSLPVCSSRKGGDDGLTVF